MPSPTSLQQPAELAFVLVTTANTSSADILKLPDTATIDPVADTRALVRMMGLFCSVMTPFPTLTEAWNPPPVKTSSQRSLRRTELEKSS